MACHKTQTIRSIKVHPARLYILFVGLTLLAAFPVLLGRFYAIGDMQTVHIPLELFFQQEIRQGHLPAWNPDVSWGFPVIAAGQIGFFYPPLFLARLILPINIYLPLILIGHLAAAGIGMYALARRLKLSAPGAALSGITFALSAFLWQHIPQFNIILTAAWLPWQMLAAHSITEKERQTPRDIARFALVLAAPFLAGQLQVPLLTAAVSSIYFIHRRSWKIVQLKKSVLTISAVAVIAILLASVQLFPTLELLQYSDRSEPANITRANQHSYPLYHLPTLLFPRFYGSDNTYWGKRLELEYGFYIGTIPFLLALWAIRKRNQKSEIRNSKQTHHRALSTSTQKSKNHSDSNFYFPFSDFKFFKYLLIISFLLALGDLSPFRLIGLEPSLWFFTGPARWLLFTTLALSYFAGIGLDTYTQNKSSFKAYARNFAILLGVGVLCANLLLHMVNLEQFIPTNNGFVAAKLSNLLMSARTSSLSLTSPYTWASLLPILVLPFILKHKKSTRIIIAVAAIELMIFASTAVPTVAWNKILTPPPIISELPREVLEKQARIISLRDGGDTGAYFTNPDSRAPKSSQELFQSILAPLVHSTFDIPGIEWPASLILTAQEQTLEQLKPDGHINQSLAEQLNIGAAIEQTNNSTDITPFIPRARAELIDDTGNPIGSAAYTEISDSHIQIQTDSDNPATLTVRDTHFPGWQAQIDNQPAAIQPAEPFFRAIPVPAGEHIVDMTYRPTRIYTGLTISTITVIAGIIILLRRKPSPE